MISAAETASRPAPISQRASSRRWAATRQPTEPTAGTAASSSPGVKTALSAIELAMPALSTAAMRAARSPATARVTTVVVATSASAASVPRTRMPVGPATTASLYSATSSGGRSSQYAP